MKKILTLILLVAIATGSISAQKIYSESHKIEIQKEPKPKMDHNWFVKGGVGIVHSSDGEDHANSLKYNITLAYQHQLTTAGLYLGGQVGVCNFLGIHTYDDGHDNGFGLYLEPMLGLKRHIGNDNQLDIHGAVGIGYSPFTEYGVWCPWEIGAGIWLDRFYIGIEYQGACEIEYSDVLNSAVLVAVGLRF